jgi:2-oxoglutarate dehydrogenase E2 component (dihydrolipoamide succinyltransferase)
MSTNITIPSLGESISEAVLIKWLKSDGEPVAAAEAIAELETDKANVDLPAPVAGVVKSSVKPGTTVKIGQVVGTIEVGSGKPAAASTKAEVAKAEAPKVEAAKSEAAKTSAPAAGRTAAKAEDLPPAARKVVAEAGVAPSAVTGTGPAGRITKEDAVAAVAAAKSAAASPAPVEPAKKLVEHPLSAPFTQSKVPATPAAPAVAAGLGTRTGDDIPFDASGAKRVPMTKIRKKIAERLVQAQHTAAILHTYNEIDLTEVMALRARHKDAFEKTHGIGLGFMSFFVKAVCQALKAFPRVNAQIDGENTVFFDHVHMGIAVSTERGLVVPVLKNAHALSFAQIESEIKRLAIAARDGKLAMDEMSGGTFTITNGGVFGSLLSAPILNAPQSGILGMHTIQKRPMVVNDQIVARSMMYVVLGYDHRMIDGKDSVSFLVRVKQLLEDPSKLLLDV